MPVGIRSFNGDRLAQARLARGLSSVGLSAIIDISPSSISLYEKGEKKPQQNVIDRMAKVLNVPVSFFFNQINIEKPKRLFYRSMSSATKTTRSKVEAEYEWACEVIDYLMEHFDFPSFELPDLDIPSNFRLIDTDLIERAAQQLREFWSLGLSPIPNVIAALERNGIIVWRARFESETLDAFSEFREPNPVVSLSTDKNNYFRSRFDGSHELAHLVLHRNIDQSTLNKSIDFKIIEDQAHLFAGAFLLPAESYSNDLWSPSLDAFRSLKPRWNVSIAMQIMRCKQLGIINEEQEKRLWINLNRRKWRAAEPLDDSTQPEIPSLISRGIKILVEQKIKSKDQIAQELSLNRAEIERICDLPVGFMRSDHHSDDLILKPRNSNVLVYKR